jgi:hypothetical protein
MEQLDSAAAAYRGDFLAGLYLTGCVDFEEWCVVNRERLGRDTLATLLSSPPGTGAGAGRAKPLSMAGDQWNWTLYGSRPSGR